MSSKRYRQLVVAGGILLVVVSAGVLYTARERPPTDSRLDAPMVPFASESAAAARVEEIQSRSFLRENVEAHLIGAGFESQSASAAADALAQYAVGMADRNIDRLVDLAILHGAKSDPRALSTAMVILETAPPRLQPQAWRDWNDIQQLRFVFEMSKDRWPDLAVDEVTVQRVSGLDVIVNETEFYMTGLLSDGGIGTVYNVPFAVPDLERKVQKGEAEAIIVTFPVTKQDGDKQMASVLLGEYAPGKWYPVRHKTVSYSAEARSNLDSTVRPPPPSSSTAH